MHDFSGMGWGMGFFWILVFFTLVVIIWLVIRLVSKNQDTQPPAGKTALDILKERYARGEIKKKEFDEKKKDIV